MEKLTSILNHLQKKHLTRELTEIRGPIEPIINLAGKRYLLLASNSYLGLNTHPQVIKAACMAIKHYGTGSCGSPLVCGHLTPHQKLTKALAVFKGTENVLLFGSGYLTNLGVLSSWAQPGDLIFSDALNHASIIDGCRFNKAEVQIYAHCDLEHLEFLLKQAPHKRTLIVTDGVFSMDGDLAPLPQIVELAQKYQAQIMVDDAHATGVLGPQGQGTAAHFGLNKEITIQIGTLSKTFGCAGGFVAGSNLLINYLKNRSRPFIFSTSMTPANAAAALMALNLLKSEPQLLTSLKQKITLWRQGLTTMGFNVPPGITPIIPIIIGETNLSVQFSKLLLEHGIFAPAIRPPSVPEGTSRIRTTITAKHTPKQLQNALQVFHFAGKKLGII